jgi:DeoR/GlpR family transcriptional regulator of sugar metabolism
VSQATKRRLRILERVEAKGRVSLDELRETFGVSDITLYRDLELLERAGSIRRIKGGAVSGQTPGSEPSFLLRQDSLADEKEAIARAVVELIDEGDVVFLDIGTTAVAVAQELRGRHNLTLITANLRAAAELAGQAGIQVVVAGGSLRHRSQSLVGALAERVVQDYFADKAILGAGGVDLQTGLTDYSMDDVAIKRLMIRQAKQKILAVDHSKLGQTRPVRIGPIGDVDMLVTGRIPDGKVAEQITALGVQLILALNAGRRRGAG